MGDDREARRQHAVSHMFASTLARFVSYVVVPVSTTMYGVTWFVRVSPSSSTFFTPWPVLFKEWDKILCASWISFRRQASDILISSFQLFDTHGESSMHSGTRLGEVINRGRKREHTSIGCNNRRYRAINYVRDVHRYHCRMISAKDRSSSLGISAYGWWWVVMNRLRDLILTEWIRMRTRTCHIHMKYAIWERRS